MATPPPDEIAALTLPEAASALENLLLSRARGGDESDQAFQALRKRVLAEAPEQVIPSFLRTTRTLQQFWAYIKKWPRYAERDEQLWSGFAPLHDALERDDVKGDTETSRRADDERGSEDPHDDYRPNVTAAQRAVLAMLHRVYLETHDWPTYAYLEQQLGEQGVDLETELRAMPELTYFPDNRRMGGVIGIQSGDKIRLLLRGLVGSDDAEREVDMFVATIKWAVAEQRAVVQQPHELTVKQWRAADAIGAMADAIGVINPSAYKCKLVLAILNDEPADLPKWSGQPDRFPDWQIHISDGIKRFRNVDTIDDYLKETHPKPPPQLRTPADTPMWPQQAPAILTATDDHPVFGRPVRRLHTFDCFVLMPLREPFKTIYTEAVEPVAAALGISCGHAEEIVGPGRIMKDIYSSITYAQVIVAELTGRNPNVFYELGMAHQQSKQVVLLSQSMDHVPFDIQDQRVVLYDWHDQSPDPQVLMDKLRPHLEEALRVSHEG